MTLDESVSESVRERVRRGFETRAEIIDWVVDTEACEDEGLVARRVDEALAQHLSEQAGWRRDIASARPSSHLER